MKVLPPVSTQRRMIPIGETDFVEVRERGGAIEATYVRLNDDGTPKMTTVFMFWPDEWRAVASAVNELANAMPGGAG